MRLVITGSPGTGKTSIAKLLASKTNHKWINEMEFALSKKIGFWDKNENELVVPLSKLRKELLKELSSKENIIVEGHLLCEIKLPVDAVILLRVDPEVLCERLERKKYSASKIADNVFCEGIDYCKKNLLRRYPQSKIIEIKNESNINDIVKNILVELKRRGIYAK
ncbi:MAG: AAA family ATPase [Candidatus Diapherotrites archaeon]